MPWAVCTTPAYGNKRAQVMPLPAAVALNTGKRGRPRKCPKVLAADKGYDAKALRQQLRQWGSRAQLPTRVRKRREPRGRPLQRDVPHFQAERTGTWFQKNTVALNPYLDSKADNKINSYIIYTDIM